MSAQAVFTHGLRFKFEQKTSGDVGDGTAFPIRVTLDQLAEIMYRVKDASFYSGSATISVTFGSGEEAGGFDALLAISGSPAATLAEASSSHQFMTVRGYCAVADGTDEPMTNFADYFGSSYSLTYGYSVVTTGNFKDIGSNEMGIWATGNSAADYNFWGAAGGWVNGSTVGPVFSPLGFRTGFSVCSASAGSFSSSAPIYGVFGYAPSYTGPYIFNSSMAVNVRPEVAWIDVTGSGNPIDPGNQLWLGIEFAAIWLGITGAVFVVSSLSNYEGRSLTATGTNLTLRLSGGVDLSCPTYFNHNDLTGVYDTATASGADFILAASEWWPYAKGSPATPVWDFESGAKL